MSKETINLTRALKEIVKCKVMGRISARKSFRKSGLEKDENMSTAKLYHRGRKPCFPDVVINLPDGKKMIVDSKVSLTAYEKYINEDDDLKLVIKRARQFNQTSCNNWEIKLSRFIPDRKP
jgi:DNA recombination protein RmuC